MILVFCKSQYRDNGNYFILAFNQLRQRSHISLVTTRRRSCSMTSRSSEDQCPLDHQPAAPLERLEIALNTCLSPTLTPALLSSQRRW